MAEKKFKQGCKSKNCGNETEMLITHSLEEHQVEAASSQTVVPKSKGKTKG